MKNLLLICIFIISFSSSAKLRVFNDKTLREKSAELSMGFRRVGEFKLEGKESGVLKGQSGYGFLLDGGYNYSQHWYFGGFFSLNTNDYKADVIDIDGNPETVFSSLSFFDLQLVTRFHFFNTALTPYVEGGIGFTSIDSGVASGKVIETCWWDPLFGQYVCGYRQTNKSVTDLSGTLGVGLKYEVTNKSFIKLASNYRVINYNKTKSRPNLWDTTLSIGLLVD